MTEDLWYHALRFLDKYRTDVRSYDLDELYEFADKTGILERHKQLLAKPYHDSQVDMKIMYYELIKMLIDYERKNHPETYDATKTVGKIEGYQELTNKLQRYLNQRFIEDIDKLAEQQLNFTQINISQKFQQLEENFLNLETRYSNLEQHCSRLQQNYSALEQNHSILEQNHSSLNQTLVKLSTTCDGLEETKSSLLDRVSHLEQVETNLHEQICQLREKDVHLEELIKQLQERQEASSGAAASLSSSVEDRIKMGEEHMARMGQQLDKLETESDKIKENSDNQDSRISALEANSAVVDNKLNNLDSADSSLLESQRILAEKIEKNIKEHSMLERTISNRLDILGDSIVNLGNENNTNKAELKSIADHLDNVEARTSNLETEVKSSKENIERIVHSIQSINQQITHIETSSAASWETVETKLISYQKGLDGLSTGFSDANDYMRSIGKELEQMKDSSTQVINGLEQQKNEILQLQESQKGNDKSLEDFHTFQYRMHTELTDTQGKLGHFHEKVDDMEKEQAELKGKLDKHDQKITKLVGDFQQLNLGNGEIVEKFHDVHLQISALSTSVKNAEEKLEKKVSEDLSHISEKLSALEIGHGTLNAKIEELDARGQQKLREFQAGNGELDSKVKGLVETTGGLSERINQIDTAHLKKFNNFDDLVHEHGEKIRLLEEASMRHYEHAQYVENLNSRVIQLDEARQKSEAKARDEVDGTLNKYNSQLSSFRAELERQILILEEQMNTSQKSSSEVAADLQWKLEELKNMNMLNDNKISNLQQEYAGRLSTLKEDFQQKFQDADSLANVLNKKVAELEKEQRENVERLVTIQETTILEKKNHTETLTQIMNKMDTEREESELKLTEHYGKLIDKNANEIQALQEQINSKLDSLEQAKHEDLQKVVVQTDSIKTQLNLLIIEQQKLVDEVEAVKDTAADKIEKLEKGSRDIENRLTETTNNVEKSLGNLKEQLFVRISGFQEHQAKEVEDIKTRLQAEIIEGLEAADSKVKEAEHHMENLRELNGKLIEQVKENMKNYENEHSKISADLKINNSQQMEMLKESFNDQLQTLINIKDEHTVSISSLSSTMLALKEALTGSSEEIHRNTSKIAELQQGQDAQDVNLEKVKQLCADLCKSVSDEAKAATVNLKDSLSRSQQALQSEIEGMIKQQREHCTENTDMLKSLLSEHSRQIQECLDRLLDQSQRLAEVEPSILVALNTQIAGLESKLMEIISVKTESLETMEKVMEANRVAIAANADVLEKHSKENLSVETFKTEFMEKITVLQAAIEMIKSMSEDFEDKILNNISTLRNELEADKKKVKETERHVTELDDTVTLLTPDIRAIESRLLHIEDGQLSQKIDDISKQFSQLQESVNSKVAQEMFETLSNRFAGLANKLDDYLKTIGELQSYCSGQFIEVEGSVATLKAQAENLDSELKGLREKNEKENMEKATEMRENQEMLRNHFRDDLKLVENKQNELLLLVDEIKNSLDDKIKHKEERDKELEVELKNSIQCIGKQISEFEQGVGGNGEKLKIVVSMHEKIESCTKELYNKIQNEVGNQNMELMNSIEALQNGFGEMKLKNSAEAGKLADEIDKLKHEQDNMKSKTHVLGDSINHANEEAILLRDRFGRIEGDVLANIPAMRESVKDNEDKIHTVAQDVQEALAKLIALEEATLQHTEKAQYIETLTARVSQVDEMRQQSEEKTKQDVSAMLNESMTKIQDLNDELQKDRNRFNDKIKTMKEEIEKGKQESEKWKAEADDFKESLSKYQEIINSKLQHINGEAHKNDETLKNLGSTIQDMDEIVKGLQTSTPADINEAKKEILLSVETLITDIKSDLDKLENTTRDSFQNHKNKLQAIDEICGSNKDEIQQLEKVHDTKLSELKNISLDSIAAIRNDYDIKIKDISDSITKQTSSIELASTFVNSSQEIFNTLTMGNAQQEERLKVLENQFQTLDKKLENLEAADLFLQEAHRMLTDKTTHVESESRRMEESLSSQLKDQQEEISTKLKVQVASLLKDFGDFTIEKSNMSQTLDAIKETEQKHKEKLNELEKGNLEITQSLYKYVENKLEGLQKEQKAETEKLESKIDNNTFIIQQNDADIRTNSEKIQGILSNLTVMSGQSERLEKNIEQFRSEAKAVSGKLRDEIDELMPQFEKSKEFLNQLQDITQTHATQIASLISGTEQLTEDKLSILDELHNAEEKFNEIDEILSQLQGKLQVLDNKNGETSKIIEEFQNLSGNMDNNLRNLEQKMEQQKATDMEGVYNQISGLKERHAKLDSDLVHFTLEYKNLSQQVSISQAQADAENAAIKTEMESLKPKIDSFLSVISNQENEFNQLAKDAKNLEENCRTIGTRLSNLELLGEKVNALDDDLKLERDNYRKELEEFEASVNTKLHTLEESFEKKVDTMIGDNLAPLKNKTEHLVTAVEILNAGRTSDKELMDGILAELKHTASKSEADTKDVKDSQVKLEDQLVQLQDRLKAIEGDSEDCLHKLASLEEATFVQAEKAKYVELLNERLGKMDEIRQQSEAKSREEMQHTVADNARAIEALKQELGESMAKLMENYHTEFTSLRQHTEARIDASNETVKSNINEEVESRILAIYSKFEEHRSLIEKTYTTVTKITEKVAQSESQQSGMQEAWAKQNESKMEALRMDLDDKIRDLFTTASEHSNILTENNISITQLHDINAALAGRLGQAEQEVVHIKERLGQDRDLIVMKFQEEKESLESYFNSLTSRVDILQITQTEESSRLGSVVERLQRQETSAGQLFEQLARIEAAVVGHEEQLGGLTRQSQDHRDLILAVEKSLRDRAAEMDQDIKSYKASSREDIKTLRADTDTDKENLWTLIVEIYSAFRGYTVVLKSEGAVREHQADVLGVYRMVDNYNERPVYKQDGGENYIYYSAASNSWLVGTVVGHQYGWLRNGTAHADTRKWIPDLNSGWEYRPLVRSGDPLTNTWCTDDGTLRIESLRDIDKVSELIRDIKNSKEVD